jgi:uncharacterized UBP type Zn finger protein
MFQKLSCHNTQQTNNLNYGLEQSMQETLEGEETAWYELVAVITHKGRTSNSGHYVG